MRSAGREGFSLLEVLLAIAILMGAVIVLNQLASIGRRNSIAAEDLATAQELCRARMNEIIAGVHPPTAREEEPILDQPGWHATVEIESRNELGLSCLTVTVSQDEEAGPRPVKFSLSRWIADPIDEPAPDGSVPNSLSDVGGPLSPAGSSFAEMRP